MQTLETKRLLLRPFQADDLDDFYAYARVEGVGEMAGWPHHKTINESSQILNSFIKGNEVYALVDKLTKKVIGSLGVHTREKSPENERDIGYVLSKEYWGQGLIPEAVKSVIHHLFTTTAIDTLTCSHFAHNTQSKRVIEKCGFTFFEQTQHHAKLLNKTFQSYRYKLTKSDHLTHTKK